MGFININKSFNTLHTRSAAEILNYHVLSILISRFDSGRETFNNSKRLAKRLIYGSLLCLSNDNFTNTFLFATIANIDKKSLQEGDRPTPKAPKCPNIC